jgi:hypothetical protein
MLNPTKLALLTSFLLVFSVVEAQVQKTNSDLQTNPWPKLKKEMHPWMRWWWMGSAVDEKNLDKLLSTYSNAGFGGVEITPIYGAIGYENRYLKFLSPGWMNMLHFTIKKAASVGMGVDMNNGTGWPFGGPQVTSQDAASKLIIQTYTLQAGKAFTDKITLKDQKQVQAGAELQALTAYGSNGEVLSLLDKVGKSGQLNWAPASGTWSLYAGFCGKTLQMVKRAAPAGEGLVMDHLSRKAVDDYLKRFDTAFGNHPQGVRAFFNDSYEVYNANWSSGLLDEFQKRRGYDLRLHLKELDSNDSTEDVVRVKSDYRETMSDMLLNNMAVNWTRWTHKYNSVSKYQAHGSPGNLLDLYAAADIPECEAYFGLSYFPIPGLRHDTSDVINPGSNPNIFKFASSAAHNYGKPFASSETFVWLTDHFKTSLSQCKPEVERLFLGGINHVFYHGTTYSPEDVPFPGWQFYAASNFTPSNSEWPQVSGLNNYIARCQSILQSGKPDNEVLIYWPVYDCWAKSTGTDMQLSMHNVNEWLTPSDFNIDVTLLRNVGFPLDYVSDKMLGQSKVVNNNVQIASSGISHKVLVIPTCNLMEVGTLKKITSLAQNGATIIFQSFPKDVPGFNKHEQRRRQLLKIIADLPFRRTAGIQHIQYGKGNIYLSADVQSALKMAGVIREELSDKGLRFIRRDLVNGKYYYLVNHTATDVDAFIPVNTFSKSVAILDPQSAAFGSATIKNVNGKTNVRVQIRSGEALILRCFRNQNTNLPSWKYLDKTGEPIAINGTWHLHFTTGGPVLPKDEQLTRLISWTQLQDSNAVAFSGTGEYDINFTLPKKKTSEYLLDLGTVDESAHLWVNGQDAGILWSIPHTARIGKYLHPGNNSLKIEVVNLMANHVRDMDQKGIKWRNYHEINFVNINYKPFDASHWDPQPSGLLGPVRIIPVE